MTKLHNFYYSYANEILNNLPLIKDKNDPNTKEVISQIKSHQKRISDIMVFYDIPQFINKISNNYIIINNDNYVVIENIVDNNNFDIFKINYNGLIEKIQNINEIKKNISYNDARFLTFDSIDNVRDIYLESLKLLTNNRDFLKRIQIHSLCDYYVKYMYSDIDKFFSPNLYYLISMLFNFDYVNNILFINKKNNLINFMISIGKFDVLLNALYNIKISPRGRLDSKIYYPSTKVINQINKINETINDLIINKPTDYSNYKKQITIENQIENKIKTLIKDIPDNNLYQFILTNITDYDKFNTIFNIPTKEKNERLVNNIQSPVNYIQDIYNAFKTYFDNDNKLKEEIIHGYNYYQIYSDKDIFNIEKVIRKNLSVDKNDIYHRFLIEISLLKYCQNNINKLISSYDLFDTLIISYFHLRMANVDSLLPINYLQTVSIIT